MRKLFYLLTLLMLIPAGSLMAQCFQKVRVLEYKGEGPKTPLANVEVIVGNAGSVVTDKKGMCQLHFRTLKPGDKVTVRRIDKDGYEVLNPEVLKQWYISRNQEDEYVIVMTSSKRLNSVRDKFQRTAEMAIQKSLMMEEITIGKQLNLNLISHEEYDKKLHKLRAEYNEKLDDIDNYIDRMVHTDINELEAEEKKVIDLVKKGDLAAALEEYNRLDLLGYYQKQLETQKMLSNASDRISEELKMKNVERDHLYESIKRQNDMLLLKGGKENVDEAYRLWHDFVYTDTTYYSGLTDYALYCERSNRLDEALDAIGYVRHSADTTARIQAELIRLQIMIKKNQFNYEVPDIDNLYQYMDSVMIAKKDSSLFLYERATALDLLCKSYALFGRQDFADLGRKYRDMSVEANRKLYEWNKDFVKHKRKYVNTLFNAYNSIYNLDYRKASATDCNHPEALEQEHYLDEAIRLQEELCQADPLKNKAMLAFLHNARATKNKAIVFDRKDTTRFEQIEAEYNTAIELYKDVYKQNPKAYAHYLAVAYANLGGLLINAGSYTDKDQSIDLLKKAVALEEEHFEYSPEASRRTYASMLWSLGVAGYTFGDYALSEQYFLKAETVFKALFDAKPASYLGSLNGIYTYLNMIYSSGSLLSSPDKISEVKLRKDSVNAQYEEYRKRRAFEIANEDKDKVKAEADRMNKSKIIDL